MGRNSSSYNKHRRDKKEDEKKKKLVRETQRSLEFEAARSGDLWPKFIAFFVEKKKRPHPRNLLEPGHLTTSGLDPSPPKLSWISPLGLFEAHLDYWSLSAFSHFFSIMTFAIGGCINTPLPYFGIKSNFLNLKHSYLVQERANLTEGVNFLETQNQWKVTDFFKILIFLLIF